MELWVKSGRKSHLYRGEAPNMGTNWLARPVPDPDFLQQQMSEPPRGFPKSAPCTGQRRATPPVSHLPTQQPPLCCGLS